MESSTSGTVDTDVVVIGGGAGGLTTAALLSNAGLAVVLVESQPQVGGYLACFERNGFRFNSSIEWLSECGPEGFVHSIFSHIGNDAPECPPMSRLFCSKNESSEYTLTDSPIELRDELIRDFPGDEAGIRQLFSDARKLADRLQSISRHIQSTESMSLLEKAQHGWQMMRLGLPISKYVRTPADKMLRTYFKSEKLRDVFCSQESFMPIIVPIAWAFSGNYQKCPEGGSQVLSDWLSDQVTRNGSKIMLSTPADEILLDEHGAACGVKLASGKTIQAKYVVAACDTLTVYEQMLPRHTIKPKLLDAMRNADLYHSCFTVFIGLDCPAAELGFGEEALKLAKTGLQREEYSSGDPDKTILNVISPSERDSTMAPAGKGSISIHCPAYMDYKNNWQTGPDHERREAYQNLKHELAEQIIDRLEAEHKQGLREHIEMINISTPITYWRYTGNSKGTSSSVKPTGKNIRAGIARHRTPVKRLLSGGHCAEYGGGLPMAVKSGSNASLIILKELNPNAYQELKKVLHP